MRAGSDSNGRAFRAYGRDAIPMHQNRGDIVDTFAVEQSHVRDYDILRASDYWKQEQDGKHTTHVLVFRRDLPTVLCFY